jgi:hypothetical protein
MFWCDASKTKPDGAAFCCASLKSNELRSALMREYVLMSVAITSGRQLSKLSRAVIREINALNH